MRKKAVSFALRRKQRYFEIVFQPLHLKSENDEDSKALLLPFQHRIVILPVLSTKDICRIGNGVACRYEKPLRSSCHPELDIPAQAWWQCSSTPVSCRSNVPRNETCVHFHLLYTTTNSCSRINQIPGLPAAMPRYEDDNEQQCRCF